MNEQHLHQIFSRLLRISLCAPALLSPGCETATVAAADMGPDLANPVSRLPINTRPLLEPGPLCSATTSVGPSTLNPAVPLTYLESGEFGPACVLDKQADCYMSSPPALERRPNVSAGTACSDAPDVGACQASLTQQLRDLCDWEFCHFRYVATTAGGVTKVLTQAPDVAALLAPVDTVQEAQLLAWMAGFDGFAAPMSTCPSADNWDARPTDSGFTMTALVTDRPSCIEPSLERCQLAIQTSGKVTVTSCLTIKPCLVIGRRPAGLGEGPETRSDTVIGDYLANSAKLEEAAVTAFAILQEELELHGAPAHLRALAEQARQDEVRHTATATALAQRYGGTPQHPAVVRLGLRSVADMAVENEVEGCVRETYGALLACWQSLHAQDPAIATAMKGIAEDETRHAALSWQVAQWAKEILTCEQREQLRALRHSAIETLRAETSEPLPPELIYWAGLPTPMQAQALIDQLAHELWTTHA